MKSEFFIDLIFIRECESDTSAHSFARTIDEQLNSLFSELANWSLEPKQEDNLDFVLVEVMGSGVWEREEDILAYLEDHASPPFWNWLQGYRIQIDVKQHAECSHCGNNQVRAEVS